MILSIHQPSYWPWLGLIDKIASSDVFVILDHVQANKASNQYRNMFLCSGKPKYITIPVNYHLGINLNMLEFSNDNWRTNHPEVLRNYYLKSPYWSQMQEVINELYNMDAIVKPIDLIIETMKCSLSLMGVKVKLIRSSELDIDGTKGELVYNICKKLDTDVYLSGQGAKSYMDQDLFDRFEAEGIEIKWQHFSHPVYKQAGVDVFVEGMSCFDMLVNDMYKAKLLYSQRYL
jgi:hypothetical protein